MPRIPGKGDSSDAPVRLEPPVPPWRGRARAALQSTDWREHAIVDLVTYAPATSLGFEDDHQQVEVYRYAERAPPPETYGTPERSVCVERVTRPLYEGRV